MAVIIYIHTPSVTSSTILAASTAMYVFDVDVAWIVNAFNGNIRKIQLSKMGDWDTMLTHAIRTKTWREPLTTNIVFDNTHEI